MKNEKEPNSKEDKELITGAYKEDCAYLWIDSTPQRARIWINGVDVGDLTPSKSGGYYLEPGTYKIELEKKNYLIWNEEVELAAGEQYEKTISLTPRVNFKINSKPERARIWLDNVRLSDLTPTKRRGYYLDAGTHHIKLEKTGYPDFETDLSLTADYDETIDLVAPPGGVVDVCLDENDNVICDADTLFDFCCAHHVSDRWWLLTSRQRKNLALKIIANWGSFIARYQGGEDVDGNCTDITSESASCVQNGLCRASRFGNTDETGRIKWCLATSPGAGFHFHFEDCPTGFHLPAYTVSVFSPRHMIAAIQIEEDTTKFSSYLFFQYDNPEIARGNWQMPEGDAVRIEKVTKIWTYSNYDFEKIAIFY